VFRRNTIKIKEIEKMATFTKIYYHIVFSTKKREKALDKEKREELYKYIWGILKNKKCYLYRINGTSDHLHILLDLHPTISLSDLMKTLKTSTCLWIKEKKIFLDSQFLLIVQKR